MTLSERFATIELVVLDIDGVLASPGVALTDGHAPIRTMHSSDAIGLMEIARSSVEIAIITGGSSQPALDRIGNLGVKHIYAGARDKATCLKELLEKVDIPSEKTLYMGDDLPDVEAMKMCGMAVCPNNSAHEVKDVADFIVNRSGGDGAVRVIIEKVLRAKKQWTG